VIRIEKLTKSYLTLRGRKMVFRDLDLEIPSKLNIGLIGRNGAGKSTLMRLLSQVDMPDSGHIHTEGSLSWPVGLSGGMQTNLSGRENVKFVCRIHGLRGEQMQHKLRAVQDFAQIGEYFDQPVTSYSSGMRARLAFGTSMAFHFDYYLIDEILAVGDAGFKAKSRQMFAERLKQSNMIMVSHNMKLIHKMCDAIVFLDKGRATFFADKAEGIAAYEALGAEA
jgi:capsular polysaccharide transport system ATP-binding protein